MGVDEARWYALPVTGAVEEAPSCGQLPGSSVPTTDSAVTRLSRPGAQKGSRGLSCEGALGTGSSTGKRLR